MVIHIIITVIRIASDTQDVSPWKGFRRCRGLFSCQKDDKATIGGPEYDTQANIEGSPPPYIYSGGFIAELETGSPVSVA